MARWDLCEHEKRLSVCYGGQSALDIYRLDELKN